MLLSHFKLNMVLRVHVTSIWLVNFYALVAGFDPLNNHYNGGFAIPQSVTLGHLKIKKLMNRLIHEWLLSIFNKALGNNKHTHSPLCFLFLSFLCFFFFDFLAKCWEGNISSCINNNHQNWQESELSLEIILLHVNI